MLSKRLQINWTKFRVNAGLGSILGNVEEITIALANRRIMVMAQGQEYYLIEQTKTNMPQVFQVLVASLT